MTFYSNAYERSADKHFFRFKMLMFIMYRTLWRYFHLLYFIENPKIELWAEYSMIAVLCVVLYGVWSILLAYRSHVPETSNIVIRRKWKSSKLESNIFVTIFPECWGTKLAMRLLIVSQRLYYTSVTLKFSKYHVPISG